LRSSGTSQHVAIVEDVLVVARSISKICSTEVQIKQGAVMESRDSGARHDARAPHLPLHHDSGAGRRFEQQARQRRRDRFDRAGAVPGKEPAQ